MSTSKLRLCAGTSRRRLGAGLIATALTTLALPLAATPASALLDPNVGPAAPHSIIVFPSRDFVHLDGYAASDVLTVQVWRAGFVVGTTAPFSPTQPDPKNPGTFMEDVNHLGQPCWSRVTPDIRGNDVVKVLTSATTGDQTPTANITVSQVATAVGATVTVRGSAISATGGQIPVNQIEARIVANKQAFSNGRRTLRADSLGKLDGTIRYDSLTATTWTATFNKLGVALDGVSDAVRAVAGDSRGQWLGRNPLAVNENTIFEVGPLIFPGPALGCLGSPFASGPSVDLAAVSDSGISNTDNVTNILSSTFGGVTGLPTATSVDLYVDGVLRGNRLVDATHRYSFAATSITPGVHTVTVGENDPTTSAPTMGNAPLTVTVDVTKPVITRVAPVVNAVGVRRTANVGAIFNEGVNTVSGGTFSLRKTSTHGLLTSVVTYAPASRIATLNPSTTLLANTFYTVTLSSPIQDTAGNRLAAKTYNFKTGAAL